MSAPEKRMNLQARNWTYLPPLIQARAQIRPAARGRGAISRTSSRRCEISRTSSRQPSLAGLPLCAFLNRYLPTRYLPNYVHRSFCRDPQFIINVKLGGLEKRREKYTAHVSKTVADTKARGKGNRITCLAAILEFMQAWPGAWSCDMNLFAIEWIHRAEAQFELESTRREHARPFWNPLTHWLQDKSVYTDISVPIEGESTPIPNGFEKVNRKVTFEQKEKLESLIFETKEIDDTLKLLQSSRVWQLPPRTLTRVDHKWQVVFFGHTERDNSIVKLRRKFIQENFFTCQFPSSDVFAEPKELEAHGPLFDTPDLEWFGPSPHFATIITILTFFWMSEGDVLFMQTFPSCPIVFKDDPSGLVRTCKSSVPIAYMLNLRSPRLSMYARMPPARRVCSSSWLHHRAPGVDYYPNAALHGPNPEDSDARRPRHVDLRASSSSRPLDFSTTDFSTTLLVPLSKPRGSCSSRSSRNNSNNNSSNLTPSCWSIETVSRWRDHAFGRAEEGGASNACPPYRAPASREWRTAAIYVNANGALAAPLEPSTSIRTQEPRSSSRMLGDYMLGKTLGAGSMGEVKLAHHNLIGEKLAIKFLPQANIVRTGTNGVVPTAEAAAKQSSKE
ncbi:hypothetical protein DFH11DRAFT_1883394, partial [Phellopilus nigrolimitatus]